MTKAPRIPYHVNSVYWGSQPFFDEPLMKYAYGAFFVTLTEEGMEAGYKIEKGLEEGESGERVLTKDWERYSFRENMKNDLLIGNLKELLRAGYKLLVLKDEIKEDFNEAEEFRNRIMNEKKLINK